MSLPRSSHKGPLVVSFNRGPWCDYCGLELHSLARAYPEIVAAGGDVISIVPETARYARALQAARGVPFRVLTDMDLGYALNLGLIFWVGDKIMDMYRGFGIDLAHFQGNGGWFLPIPATLVVGRDGKGQGPLRRSRLPPTHAHRGYRRGGAEGRARPGLRPCPFGRHLQGKAKRPGQRPVRLKFSYRHPSLTL